MPRRRGRRGRSGRSRTHRGRRQACNRRATRTVPARRGPPASVHRRRSPGLRSRRARSPSPTRTLPASTKRLRTGARLDQAALDEELVESDAGPFGRRRAHPAIVAQRPSPRLDRSPRVHPTAVTDTEPAPGRFGRPMHVWPTNDPIRLRAGFEAVTCTPCHAAAHGAPEEPLARDRLRAARLGPERRQ